MKVRVKVNVIRREAIEVDDKFKALLGDIDLRASGPLIDQLYDEVNRQVEANKADNEYIDDVVNITEVETNECLMEM